MEVDGGRLTPLDYAIIGGHQDVAQLLIENGALSISGIQELAAIVIQKIVRGFLVRRRYAGVLPSGQKQQEEAGEPSPPPAPSEVEEGVAPTLTTVSAPTTATQDVDLDSGHDRRRYKRGW